MWSKNPRFYLSGFGVAETLIASTILASMALAFFGVSSSINRNISLANERAVAAQIAQEGIEQVRLDRERAGKDSRSQAGAPSDWDQYLMSNVNRADQVVAGVNSSITFKRNITIEQSGLTLPVLTFRDTDNSAKTLSVNQYDDDFVRVKVQVKWNSAGRERSYELYTILTNWQTATL